jgi:hypothetical protein
MSWHNDTCGCAECGNYGQRYNPRAIHNQSCGCSECGNYDSLPISQLHSEAAQPTPSVAAEPAPSITGLAPKNRKKAAKKPAPGFKMVAVPVEFLQEVHALIAGKGTA